MRPNRGDTPQGTGNSTGKITPRKSHGIRMTSCRARRPSIMVRADNSRSPDIHILTHLRSCVGRKAIDEV
jgi:hypothetical protein